MTEARFGPLTSKRAQIDVRLSRAYVRRAACGREASGRAGEGRDGCLSHSQNGGNFIPLTDQS
jgi:hypothetical protein